MTARTDPDDWGDIPMPDDSGMVFVNRAMLPPRPPIVRGEWVVTLQLRVETAKDSGVYEWRGDPLELHYSDAYLAGRKSVTKETKGGSGCPEDFGDLMTRALYERAQVLRRKPRGKK